MDSYNPKPRDRTRMLCQSCRYRMVLLEDFDGHSSQDAPDIGGYGATGFDLWGWLYNLVRGGARLRQRQSEAKRLREEILPEYPNSQICPLCMSVVMIN